MTRQGAKKTKRLLKSYEDTHPNKTSTLITTAIINGDNAQLREIAGEVGEEIRNGQSQDTYYLREWKTLCEKLAGLSNGYTEMRKYKQGKTPDTTGDTDVEIISEGAFTTYQLHAEEYAVVVSQTQKNTSAHNRTVFKTSFTKSPTVFFKHQLHPNNWYRPKDIP